MIKLLLFSFLLAGFVSETFTCQGKIETINPSYKGVSEEGCSNLCSDTDECRYWMYMPHNKLCMMRRITFVDKSQITSGSKDSSDTCTVPDLPDIDDTCIYQNKQPKWKKLSSTKNVSSAAACKALCSANSKCEYYTYVGGKPSKACILKRVQYVATKTTLTLGVTNCTRD